MKESFKDPAESRDGRLLWATERTKKIVNDVSRIISAIEVFS